MQHQWIYATHYKRVALAEFKVSFGVSHKAVFSHVLIYFLLDRLLQKMLLGETFSLNNEKLRRYLRHYMDIESSGEPLDII